MQLVFLLLAVALFTLQTAQKDQTSLFDTTKLFLRDLRVSFTGTMPCEHTCALSRPNRASTFAI